MIDSRQISKLLFVLCIFVWTVAVCRIASADRFDTVVSGGFSPVSSAADLPAVGTYFTLSSPYMDRNYYLSASTPVNVGGIYNNPGTNTVSYGHSGYVVNSVSFTWYQLVSGRYRIHTAGFSVSISPTPPNESLDTDGDGVKDDIDPCPESYDEKFKLYRIKNICTGSYYIFQITGECGVTETYSSPLYENEKAALADALANPECAPTSAMGSASMSAQDFENWYAQHHPNVNVGGSSPDETLPDLTIPDPTGGNSTVHIPPKPVDASDPDSQKVIDQIERMKVAVEQAVQFSGQNVAGQVQITGDQIVAGLKGVTNAVNGLSMGGVSTAVNSAAATAHSDSQAMLQKLEEIKNKPVSNATATATLELPSVSVSGSFDIPEPGVLEPVSEDRVIAAKERFTNAWGNLKNSFSGLFDVDLSGSGSLPVWTWPMLGKNVVIDFNEYSTQLNWIGLALLFIASVYAIFIVFGN